MGGAMKTFITGATGFIGTHLLKRLSQTSHQLYCLARRSSNTQHLKEAGANIVLGDVTDKNSVLEGMKGCDSVINLANIYTFWEPHNRIYTDVNVEGTRNVMESALANNISKVVHLSTVLIYGKPKESPFNEESPVGPVRFSEYARTKYRGDLIAWKLFKEKKLPLVVIYPAMVIGPGNPKFGGQFVRNLVERRMAARATDNHMAFMVHVRDVAEVIVRALEKEGNIGQKYLVGQQIYMREFYQMVSQISGVPSPSIYMPDSVAMAGAFILTMPANLTKKAPMWGLSIDSLRTGTHDVRVDATKVERELGIKYSPIKLALEEEIASYRG
jgi:dihydroflavonol-4-reductase